MSKMRAHHFTNTRKIHAEIQTLQHFREHERMEAEGEVRCMDCGSPRIHRSGLCFDCYASMKDFGS